MDAYRFMEKKMTYRILLVEDNPHISENICDFFTGKEENTFQFDIASDGIQGLTLAYENTYDLIMLDIMLPKMDGFTICKNIRKKSIIPIIFLTAKGREEDVLFGYELGCDDYIVKPFSNSELLAKTKAIIKRSKGMIRGEELTCGNISLNPYNYVVTAEGKEIDLPPKQFALLKYLMENKNLVVSRETLLVTIWGYDYEGNDRVVDNHIKKLRKALGNSGKQIKTVISQGYKLLSGE